MSGENTGTETPHRLSRENLNRLSRENAIRLSTRDSSRMSIENANRLSRDNACRLSGDSRSINSTKIRYEAEARKVSFHIQELPGGRRGGGRGRRGRQEDAQRMSVEMIGRRRIVEVCLIAAALVMVWVLYSITIIALGVSQTQVSPFFSKSPAN